MLLSAIIVSGCSCGDSNGPDHDPGNTIVALNGQYYKGVMGGDTFDQPLEFVVTDSEGRRLVDQQIQINPFEGDGSTARSMVTDSDGVATLPYSFSGSLGHARILLEVEGIDTLTVFLRADVLTPGPHGQAGYVLFDDDLAMVRNFLGEPDSYDIFPSVPSVAAVFANYENSRGLVVSLYDLDKDYQFYDTSSVAGVIVNTIYDGTTTGPNPIGIGSTLDDLRAAYGEPDFLVDGTLDTTVFGYAFWGLSGFAWAPAAPDTILTELHFSETVIRPDKIVALNGVYFQGSMGSVVLNPAPEFVVEDIDGNRIGNVEFDLTRLEGDGSYIGNDGIGKMKTDPSTGIADFSYNFNGSLGHAVLRMTIPDIDTLDVSLRANVLIPGPTGQGQYILFSDTYADIVEFNGQPTAIATSGRYGPDFVYAGYEVPLGVTFVLHDADRDGQVYDTSSVYGIIADTAYTGQTVQNIGIGSTLGEVRAVYGTPVITPLAGDTINVLYDTIGAEFDAVTAGDTTVVRVLFSEHITR